MAMQQRVLIVDDEIDTLKLLKMIVELSGYEAYTTLNSLEAITMAQVEQPDVVLLDVMMPKLDGFQLCKMLRADPKTRHLPVIFVTAYDALDIEDRRIESGGDMVLPKPVGMDELIKAIKDVQEAERHIPEEIQKAASDITLAKAPDIRKELLARAGITAPLKRPPTAPLVKDDTLEPKTAMKKPALKEEDAKKLEEQSESAQTIMKSPFANKDELLKQLKKNSKK